MLKKQITFAECQRQRTESRRSAKAKHLKNVRDKKSARDGRKLAKNEVIATLEKICNGFWIPEDIRFTANVDARVLQKV